MRQGPRYNVKPRRRREGRTDYRQRLKILKSRKVRVVVRKSLKHTTVQFVEYKEGGDKIIAAANSKELASKYNWKHSTSNTPAAYLTGILAGSRASEKKIKESILDIGRYVPVTGSKVFAVAKGIMDVGIDIAYDEKKLPKKDRLTGKSIDAKIESDVNKIKTQITGGK